MSDVPTIFGLIPDPDPQVTLGISDAIVVPDYMDIAYYFNPPEWQGNTPWCVAHSVCAVGQAYTWKKYGKPLEYNEEKVFDAAKRIDGRTPAWAGTTEDAGIQAGIECGVLPVGTKRHVIKSREELKQAMHRFTWVIGGFYVTPAWKSIKLESEGRLPDDWSEFIGAHEVTFTGYTSWGVHFCNWWGRQWGQDGFGWMSWDMFDKTMAGGSALEVV